MRVRAIWAGRMLALVAGLLATPAVSQTYPFQNRDLSADARLDNLLSLMTTDEKLDVLGTNSAVPRLGVPSFGSSEGIHGVVQRQNDGRFTTPVLTTQFPQPPGMGASWDPDLVRKAGAVQGHEARYISQNPRYDRRILMLWGPQADLARDPRWGRSEEVYGEDPFLAGTMATAFARGLEGDDPKYWQAAPLLKHFLANSNENGRASSSSDFDERLFWEYYSVPFRMTFEGARATGVMTSYNAWNGTPLHIHPLVRETLIGRWGAEVVSSDGGGVGNLVKWYKRYPSQKEAVVATFKAGINQYLDVYRDELKAALGEGLVTTAELDEAVRRKFRVSLRLGLLDPPERNPYAAVGSGPPPWDGEESRAVSRQLALESLVLLKNSGGALPLQKSRLKSIAVIGPLAASVRWDWYGGYPPYSITPLAGIRQAVGPDVAVSYAADDKDGAAVKAAKAAEVAIVVVGNDPTCGPNMARDWTDNGTKPCADAGDGREGRDRETISLAQEELVQKVMAANPRTVMVLVSSFPFAINWSQANVPAILQTAHSSQDQGWAIAEALFGDYNPGGHTVATWPASLDQLPPMMDYDIRHGRTYMYAKGQPLYPFGHGLSYTSFRYSGLRAEPLTRNGATTVTLTVTNTGRLGGDAVPQLYVRHLGSRVGRPPLKLEGFQRVHLEPGESRTVHIPLEASQLGYWNTALKAFEVEAERVELMVGASSADIKLRRTIQVR